MPLPRLRPNLDFLPSPKKERPGLLIRDPYQYSDATLLVPMRVAPCLALFDGERTEADLRECLQEISGQPEVTLLQQNLMESLSKAGFLEDEAFAARKARVERDFAESPVRLPQHAGSGYPANPQDLAATLRSYLQPTATPSALSQPARKVLGIAAPHVSPFGGIDAYRAAYSCLTPADADKTFIVLGTSHYGPPDRFGLTRKPFRSPLGETATDAALIEELARNNAGGVVLEDYCHAIEHSIEFQVIFLQHLYGPKVRVVPILCGAFWKGMEGKLPEDDPQVERTIHTLGEIAARESSRLRWVLGVDMAHMGQRYDDSAEAVAGEGSMLEVQRRDRDRIARMEAGDAAGFWAQIQQNRDDLKWCGSSPIYTFLRAVPQARGALQHYQQWNIDPGSVVSFAGIQFS